MAPLLRGAPLSKDAISRLVGRLREDFESWAKRDLAEHRIRHVYLDGWYPRVRIGKKRVRVPVLVTLGTAADGHRVILDLRIAGEESEAAWSEVIESLIARNVGRPELAIIDGNPGLEKALGTAWPKIDIRTSCRRELPFGSTSRPAACVLQSRLKAAFNPLSSAARSGPETLPVCRLSFARSRVVT